MEDGAAVRDGGNPSRAVVGDIIKCRAKPGDINFRVRRMPPGRSKSVAAPTIGCIAGEMPSAVIAAAEVAAVTTGSIAVLTEVVTDIDVLSNYALKRSNMLKDP